MTPTSKRRITLAVLFLLLLAMDVSTMVLYKFVEIQVDNRPDFYWHVVTHPLVWTGLAIGLAHLWVWTRILSMTRLSVAYPASSASYPITMLISMWVFHERFQHSVWLGAAFIVLGIILVGSARPKQSADPNAPLGMVEQFHELP